jgi:hypothetical protein
VTQFKTVIVEVYEPIALNTAIEETSQREGRHGWRVESITRWDSRDGADVHLAKD